MESTSTPKPETKSSQGDSLPPMVPALGSLRSRAGARKSKYGNVKTEYKGRLYDSKREAEYAAELDLLQRADHLYWFPQWHVPLHVNRKQVAIYKADFYVVYKDGRSELVDVKGAPLTAVFRLKQKMVEAEYGIKIKIVR